MLYTAPADSTLLTAEERAEHPEIQHTPALGLQIVRYYLRKRFF